MSFKLKNILVCENVIVSFNGQPSLINLVSEITSSAFPAVHPKLTIMVNITGDTGFYDEKIEIISLLSEKKIIATVGGKIEIKEQGGSSFVGNFINTIFPNEGKYWIKVSINNEVVSNEEDHFIQLKRV